MITKEQHGVMKKQMSKLLLLSPRNPARVLSRDEQNGRAPIQYDRSTLPKLISGTEQGGQPSASFEKPREKVEWVQNDNLVIVNKLQEMIEILKRIEAKTK